MIIMIFNFIAKWSSTEEINYKEGGSFKDIPKVQFTYFMQGYI